MESEALWQSNDEDVDVVSISESGKPSKFRKYSSLKPPLP